MRKTQWKQMLPEEFTTAIHEAPIAYLPLGTLEWHGFHLPLGSDGIQAEALFEAVAQEVGGVVMPMLFLGPDRNLEKDKEVYHGMDIYRENRILEYPTQKMPGSAYWVNDSLFDSMVEAIVENVSRIGIRILVVVGHGPSTKHFLALRESMEKKYSIRIVCPWDDIQGEYEYMNDHAASNETSIVQYTTDLADMSKLKDETYLIGMIGKSPLQYASKEYGEEIFLRNKQALIQKLTQLKKEITVN